MSKIFSYNFEKFSARDIVNYCRELNLAVQFKKSVPGQQERGFLVNGTAILIRMPDIDYIIKLNFNKSLRYFASVRWDTYSFLYYPDKEKEIILSHTFGPRNDQLFKEHEKLFNQLKRKFQMGDDEVPKAIKDLDWIRNLGKYGYEKAEELYLKNNNKKKILGIF